MELHHRSYVLPSNAPALPEPDTFIPSCVLQERSANRRHDYSEGAASCKRSPTTVYSSRLGGYFTGNLGCQFSGEKSEAQIDIESKKLLKLVKNCDKYQKYRERQPTEKELSKRKEKERRWPDHLEEAFFRALVRWPPMGRHQLTKDGQPRGRNELVADSIQRETGVPRDRKQVSSHIQVLKLKFVDEPQILVYMSTANMGGRSGRGRHTSAHFRHRHASHKYSHSQVDSDLHQSFGHLPSSLALAKLQAGHEESPYTVHDFKMAVEIVEHTAHDFIHLSSNSRLDDLHVTDTNSWHKQYPEFKFHRTDELTDHHVLICDATIKVMTPERPAGATLSITFDLGSQMDLSVYDSLECRTRFFENGKVAHQLEAGDDGQERKVKHTLTPAEYHGKYGLMRVHFGSKFWAHQMQKLGSVLAKAAAQEEQPARSRYEDMVHKELQNMTAAQDIYGRKDGERVCLLTILWRFSQTRTSSEQGRMTWRAASFGQRKWVKEEELAHIRNAKELAPPPPSISLLMNPIPSPPQQQQHMYPAIFPDPFALDALALEAISSTDFSQPSEFPQLPSLSHSQDPCHQSQDFPDTNDFDFSGGHLSMAGRLEPLTTYDAYPPTLPNLASIMGLDASHGHASDLGFPDLTGMQTNCYATKPSWHHPSLISHLESAAETFGGGELMGAGEGWGHGAFGEDTGVGAEGRRDSKVGEGYGERERVWRL